jgi:hypothetical protein
MGCPKVSPFHYEPYLIDHDQMDRTPENQLKEMIGPEGAMQYPLPLGKD